MVNEVRKNMIPFYLVTGFLGSGKTTFLKEVLAGYSSGKRIAVIQNEFAPTGVDGIELKMTGTGFRLVEINNGSVFCVCLMATFVESLQNLIEEYKPEMIFLEASGLADPVNIIELLGREGLNGRVGLAHIITIVDAPHFEKGRKTLPRFRHQIMIADTVLINKSDVFEGSKALLYDQIRSMNPFAGIIETSYCKADLKGLIFQGENISGSTDSRSEIPGKVTSGRNSFEGTAAAEVTTGSNSSDEPSPDKISGERFYTPGAMHKAAAAFTGRKPGGRPDINACVLRAHEKLTPEGLRSFIKELQESSPRIKGFINLENGNVMAVQTVFENCEISEISGYDGPTELVAFGRDLTPRYLRDLLRKHSS
jgi:G3E family GTPase